MDNYSTIEGMIRQSTNNPVGITPTLKFKKTHEDAVLPRANNCDAGTGDSGYDLTAVENVVIPKQGCNVVPVGLKLADITPGYWFRIEPRSGLGFKHSIQPHLGVIDNGYRGDLGVKLYNFDNTTEHRVKKGDKIAQFVVYPLIQPRMSFTDEVSTSARGEKGFGSSDTNKMSQSDDWFHANTYQVDEGRIEHPMFDTIEELIEYAKQTNMPDSVLDQIIASGGWVNK